MLGFPLRYRKYKHPIFTSPPILKIRNSQLFPALKLPKSDLISPAHSILPLPAA